MIFSELYYRIRLDHEKKEKDLEIRYKIVTSAEEYIQTKKISLGFIDRPGDHLRPKTAHELVADDDIICHLHPKDVQTITALAIKERENIVCINSKEKATIAKIYFDTEKNLEHYLIEEGDIQFALSKDEILENKPLLQKLPANDLISMDLDQGLAHANNTIN